MSDHRTFTLQPSRFQFNKFKDLLHYYLMLGLIPCGLGVMLTNIFIGPATLSEIPEGYTPEHWEYCRVKTLILNLLTISNINILSSTLLPVS